MSGLDRCSVCLSLLIHAMLLVRVLVLQCAVEPPVPVSNTVVKRRSADTTAGATRWDDRPVPEQQQSPQQWGLLFFADRGSRRRCCIEGACYTALGILKRLRILRSVSDSVNRRSGDGRGVSAKTPAPGLDRLSGGGGVAPGYRGGALPDPHLCADPRLSGLVRLVCPAPFVLLGLRRGVRTSMVATVGSYVVLSALVGPVFGTQILVYGLLGTAYAAAARLRLPYLVALALGAIIYGGYIAVLTVGVPLVLGVINLHISAGALIGKIRDQLQSVGPYDRIVCILAHSRCMRRRFGPVRWLFHWSLDHWFAALICDCERSMA